MGIDLSYDEYTQYRKDEPDPPPISFTLQQMILAWEAGWEHCWSVTDTPPDLKSSRSIIEYFKQVYNIDIVNK